MSEMIEDIFYDCLCSISGTRLGASQTREYHFSHISVSKRIVVDDGVYFLLFLQDMFPYLDKYLVSDYLPKLTERISYVMKEYKLESPCNKTLLPNLKHSVFY